MLERLQSFNLRENSSPEVARLSVESEEADKLYAELRNQKDSNADLAKQCQALRDQLERAQETIVNSDEVADLAFQNASSQNDQMRDMERKYSEVEKENSELKASHEDLVKRNKELLDEIERTKAGQLPVPNPPMPTPPPAANPSSVSTLQRPETRASSSTRPASTPRETTAPQPPPITFVSSGSDSGLAPTSSSAPHTATSPSNEPSLLALGATLPIRRVKASTRDISISYTY